MSDNYTADPIRQIQDDIEQQIRNDPWFSNVAIVRSETGDIIAAINEKVGSLGLCISISPLEGRVEGGGMLEMEIGLTINENPLLNRSSSGTQKTATQAVIQLCRVFSDMAGKLTILNRWELGDDTGGVLRYRMTGKATARMNFV